MLGVGTSAFAALFLVAGPAVAARNREAETFVERNATEALRALATRSADGVGSQEVFARIVTEFADVPRISTFVLGQYAGKVRQDPTLGREWADAFQAFTIASYADRLRSYAGSAVHVVGSVERVPNQDVVVRSEIPRGAASPPRIVEWRMIRGGERWRVADVGVILDGNEVWLAQQQKSQFTSVLGRSNGDVRALIVSVRQTTATLNGATAH